MWFLFALVCTLAWGGADLFYKKGSDADDRYSHLKIAVWVGLVMGAGALVLMLFTKDGKSCVSAANIIKYSPASLSYIISMIIGYAGMRYLEISIISPVQNASGALSAAVMIVYFGITGGIKGVLSEFSGLDIIGTVIIVAGVVMLGVVEQRLSKAERLKEDKKYRFGALALIFPILYCIFDTIGTAADGIILNSESMDFSEIQLLVLYGLTFFLAGCVCYIVLLIKTKKAYNPFADLTKGTAALFEEGGQIFYVYAMAKNPVIAAPMVASYCIVSVLLSRIFLKERLKAAQYACVISVIAGIVMLGISEGLAEM